MKKGNINVSVENIFPLIKKFLYSDHEIFERYHKFKIKSGDTVRVIAGDHKGSEGKVLQIIKDKDRVVVEGVNMISKHTKPSAQSPQGGIVKKEASMHISNLLLVEDGVVVRVGYKVDGDTKTRISKKTKK